MSFLQALHFMIIGPLELLFEVIYQISYKAIGNVGLAIIPVSLAINFLCLPLYLRADHIQSEARDKEEKMKPMSTHIKKSFKGDERYMMLQAYYRIEGYKPIHSLRSSFSLLLQIPFFMAAYHFLSHLTLFQGVSFGPIRDLSLPDGALTIGGIAINILPILMTIVNIVSSSIYSKKTSLRDKIQLYGLALIFLVLLYRSPSGLVFYWLLNNIFSLCKNIVMVFGSRIKAAAKENTVPVKLLKVLGYVFAGACAVGSLAVIGHEFSEMLKWDQWNTCRIFLALVVFVLSLVCLLRKAIRQQQREKKQGDLELPENSGKRFMAGCLFMALLIGVLIPSAVISDSPMDFVTLTNYQSPLKILIYSVLTAAGTFLFWFGIFYYLADGKGRAKADFAILLIAGLSTINYMAFGTNLGNMSPILKYDMGLDFSVVSMVVNVFVCLAAFLILLVIMTKKPTVVRSMLNLMSLVIAVMSVYNIVMIRRQIPQIEKAVEQVSDTTPTLRLSKTGKNVVVLILDKAVDAFVPFIFNEKPILKEQFEGFTWYSNTISYGNMTNVGSPGLYGGYEYIPEEMNRRSDEWLGDKQNEAVKLMPVLFDEAGYEVTVCDPAYAGYQNIPDLSIYDDHPDIRTFITDKGYLRSLTSDYITVKESIWKRNFFCFGIMKSVPLELQSFFYQDGNYFYSDPNAMFASDLGNGETKSVGGTEEFMNSYAVLQALPDITELTDEAGAFVMLHNLTTHNPIYLQTPDYTPSATVDNSKYNAEHADRFNVDGRKLLMNNDWQQTHYHVNVAALLQVGNWLDYLREQGVYDNTRIIIVADHGASLYSVPELSSSSFDATYVNPLLLVKDFNCNDAFAEDDTFMTNADTPLLALSDLISDPVNPFTGNALTDDQKDAEEQHILITQDWQVDVNIGNTFLPGDWYAVRNQNIYDKENWEYLGEH